MPSQSTAHSTFSLLFKARSGDSGEFGDSMVEKGRLVLLGDRVKVAISALDDGIQGN
jgi:hypothetical protein